MLKIKHMENTNNQTMQTDKIIAAIAAYLEEETAPSPREDRLAVEFGGVINRGHFTHAGFCQEIATEIAAAIAPLVEAKDYPYPELFDHMANEHGLTLTNTELGDIIHVARKDAPLVEGELCELKKLKIGDKVQIIALLDHSPAYGHEAPIGYEGYITAIDSSDFDLPYEVDMRHWVSRGEVTPIP